MNICITKVRLTNWEISLGSNTPLVVTTGNLERIFPSRRGSYLVIEASDEKKSFRGIGELVEPVFTLPGEDPSTILVEAREVLRHGIDMVRGEQIGIEWKTDIDRLISSAFVRANIDSRMSIRIARFCLEQSLLTMVADVLGKPLWWVMRMYLDVPHPSGDLDTNPIVRLNSMFNLRQGDDLDQIPNGVVKLKVGGLLSQPSADAMKVSYVAERIKEGQSLRLDANQSRSCDDYRTFIEHLSPNVVAKIEYIEEPFRVACTDELRKCLASCRSSIVVALDESLLYKDIESILMEYRNLKVVNKVFLHGLKDSDQNFLSPTRTTFTCTFESGVGLGFLVSLAYAVNSTQYHGLHPLQQMMRECPITRAFFELIKNDKDGFFVNVNDVESVLRNFSFSI